MRRCNIPARTLPPCDLEWGHDGELHANCGDGFCAPDYRQEHRLRQRDRRRLALAMAVVEAARQNDTFAHWEDCDGEWDLEDGTEKCTCGLTRLRRALAAFDAAKGGGHNVRW